MRRRTRTAPKRRVRSLSLRLLNPMASRTAGRPGGPSLAKLESAEQRNEILTSDFRANTLKAAANF
eukprot:3333293-Pleurochrysis_carterae.AAC.1